MKDEPLGLPKGSVRSLLALGIVLAFAAGSGYLIVAEADSDLVKLIAGGWLVAVTNVVKDYFGMRDNS